MNKKLRILINEPLLLIALPISFITLFIIIILKPFIKIRIGFLHSDRIGHFAANTELYLCERDIEKKGKYFIDLFYFPTKVCNYQLATMWKRQLHLLPWFWLRPLCLVIRSFPCLASYRVMESRGGALDIDNLLDKVPAHLEFTAEEEVRGNTELEAMGIPNGSSFVCLMVRDGAYLAQLYKSANTNYHSYRDSNIQNYVLAAEALANRGIYVIRMGAKVQESIKTTHPKIIDYATNGMRSDFMDIYLGAKCTFCISTGTGLDAIPEMLRRPIVYVNFSPLGDMHTFRKEFLCITKKYLVKASQKVLTLREIFDHGCGFFRTTSEYDSRGLILIENTPEEIRDVVLEMSDRLNGTWVPHEDDEGLQRKFWGIFPGDALDRGGVPLHGEIRSHYGANFLRENRWWLE